MQLSLYRQAVEIDRERVASLGSSQQAGVEETLGQRCQVGGLELGKGGLTS